MAIRPGSSLSMNWNFRSRRFPWRIRWLGMSLLVLVTFPLEKQQLRWNGKMNTMIVDASPAYHTKVLGLLKDINEVLDSLHKIRSGEGDNKGAKRIRAFKDVWISSWTGIPSLGLDYMKIWLSKDEEQSQNFQKLKRRAENWAKDLHELFEKPELADRKAFLRENASKFQNGANELMSEMYVVFKSGYIHDCIKQVHGEFRDIKIFEDLIQLTSIEVDALMHLLGQPMQTIHRTSTKEL